MIAVGDASPWLVGAGVRNIFHYNNDVSLSRSWPLVDSSTGNIGVAVSPEGIPWKIASNHVVYELANGSWVPKPATFPMSQAWEVAVGRNEAAWMISTSCGLDCAIFYWNGSAWIQTQGGAQHVAVAPDGSAYVTNHSGTVFKWNGSSWDTFGPPGTCAQNNANGGSFGTPVIGAGPNDSVWVLGCGPSGPDQPIFAWSTNLGTWQQVPGAASTISVGADGTPWVINSANQIYEYVSSWQPVGPWGFTWQVNGVNEIWTGEIHDVDATPSTGAITVGVTSGGVWQTPPTLGWVPLSDMGAGVAARPGPTMAVGTVAVKPTDQNTVIVGTGVAGRLNYPSQSIGNGIWVTQHANWTPVPWQPSTVYNAIHQPMAVSTVVKLRYSRDATKVYAITPQDFFMSSDDGATFGPSFSSSCTPAAGHVFTDLVVDPNNSNVVYLGVAGEGVYRFNGSNCDHGNPPPLFQGASSSITSVALAISNYSVLYAAFAGLALAGYPGNDFENVDATSLSTWPQWSVVVPVFVGWGLGSQNTYAPPTYPSSYGQAHDWALGTDPSGSYILLGGIGLYRGSGCGPGGCASFDQINPGDKPTTPEHRDYHAIAWSASTGTVYVVNDGGIFSSLDNGLTWYDQINNLGVCNEVSVDVVGSNIFAAAWDTGGHYTTNMGATWLGDPAIDGQDGHQAVADIGGGIDGFVMGDYRSVWNGSTWANVDGAPNNPGWMAKGRFGPLFTTGANSDLHIFAQFAPYTAGGWTSYQTALPQPPLYVVASNESPRPTVYVPLASDQLSVSVNNGAWLPAVTPAWPQGYHFRSSGAGSVVTIDRGSNDFYVVGVDANTVRPVILKSPVGSHGSTWIPMTGSATGAPGTLKQDEIVNAVFVDSSTQTIIVGTDGSAPASTIYGASSIWRLNNASTQDTYHHWRPWVNGLPVGMQPMNWISGQYENGVFYYYAATWGRGIWKREARGGDQ